MSTKLISLDASTSATGVAVFVDGKYKESYVIETNKKIKGDEKLEQMIDLIHSLIEGEKPDIVIAENIVSVRNANTTRMLQELIGAIRGHCVYRHIVYRTLRPTEWRSQIVKISGQKPEGRKREDQKVWSLDVVNNKFNIKTESDDEADAVCIGRAYIEMMKKEINI